MQHGFILDTTIARNNSGGEESYRTAYSPLECGRNTRQIEKPLFTNVDEIVAIALFTV